MKTHSPSSKIKSRKMHDQALVVADPWSAVVPIYPRRINSPVILVSDQYHTMASQLAQQYINADNSAGVEPVPKSFQINGLAGVRTPWCGGAGQPPCRSSVINAAPLGSCASPTTDMIFVSGAAFAFVRIHLESSVPLNATLRTVDGISLAKPIPVLMTPASPVELQPGQRVRIALCSDDPAAASAKPARIVIRAPLEQFGTVGECDQEILVPSSDRIRWKTRAQGRRWGGVGVGVEERRREREREIETPHFFLFPQLNDFFFPLFFPAVCSNPKNEKHHPHQTPTPTASASTARPARPRTSTTARSSTRRRPCSTLGGPTLSRPSRVTRCPSRARCRCRSTGRRSSLWCSLR